MGSRMIRMTSLAKTRAAKPITKVRTSYRSSAVKAVRGQVSCPKAHGGTTTGHHDEFGAAFLDEFSAPEFRFARRCSRIRLSAAPAQPFKTGNGLDQAFLECDVRFSAEQLLCARNVRRALLWTILRQARPSGPDPAGARKPYASAQHLGGGSHNRVEKGSYSS
jgi:hypothetical protein